MPIIKSAKKRVRTAEKAVVRNSKTKRNVKNALKSFNASLEKGGENAEKELQKVQSTIDTAAKKNVMHKNKAARKKSQAAKAAKAAGIKLTPAKKSSSTKKTATAKKTTKKSATTKKKA